MKTKVFTAVLIVVSLLWAFSVGAQSDEPRVWLTTSAEQANAGDEVIVMVHISGAVEVYGGSFKLTYDPQAFEVVLIDSAAVQPGSFFGVAPSFPLANKAEAGVIDYAMTLVQPAEPVSGDGVLGTITLRALQAAAVTVTPVEASLVSPQFTEIDGRKVAQQMNKITPELAQTTVTEIVAPLPAESNGATASVATASVAGALAAQAPAPGQLEFLPVPVIASPPTSSPAFIFAALLFMMGMGMLVVSVGLYTRMRSTNLLLGE